MPRAMSIVITAGKATLRELQEFYSPNDLYNLVEVITVEAYNNHLLSKPK